MNYIKFKNKVIIRIDLGEEIVATIKKICNELNIKLATISGIGATNNATIGLYDVSSRKYQSKKLTGDNEIAPLYGNVTMMNNENYIHIHVNLCDSKNRSYGGHLNSAIVSETFEGVIDIIYGEVERKSDDKIGLNLLDI